MPREKADFAWYSAESQKQKLPPRCPIAHAELCPRYYSSAVLLGEVGHFAKFPSERRSSLDRKWKAFESAPPEELPSRFPGDNLNHFCPEVSGDRFGYFASDLYAYSDEIDRASDKKDYRDEGNFGQYDPNWQTVRPCHYTECREYSIYGPSPAGKRSGIRSGRGGVSPRLRFQVFQRDSYTCQYCGRKAPEGELEVDHKVSVKDGGSERHREPGHRVQGVQSWKVRFQRLARRAQEVWYKVMPIVYVVSGGDDNPPPQGGRGSRRSRNAVQYTAKCKGLTRSEASALSAELNRHFHVVRPAQRNPAPLHPHWDEVLHVTLLVGGAAGKKLLDFLASFIRERLARGKTGKEIILYGPNSEILRRFRKGPLR